MKSLAERIYDELNEKGACLGTFSIFLIQKVLDKGLEDLQDKLHRRNALIKKLREDNRELKDSLNKGELPRGFEY